MTDALLPVVLLPALIAGGWVGAGLRAAGLPRWSSGAIVAAGLAGVLVLAAAFLPVLSAVATLGIPVLCVGAAALLLLVFARLEAVALALAVPPALLIALQPPLFPFLMPLILALPLWTVGWIDRERATWRYALAILAALVAVPLLVFGGFYLLRGRV